MKPRIASLRAQNEKSTKNGSHLLLQMDKVLKKSLLTFSSISHPKPYSPRVIRSLVRIQARQQATSYSRFFSQQPHKHTALHATLNFSSFTHFHVFVFHLRHSVIASFLLHRSCQGNGYFIRIIFRLCFFFFLNYFLKLICRFCSLCSLIMFIFVALLFSFFFILDEFRLCFFFSVSFFNFFYN
jgi:hypothetical protein